jgi:hypothetical protein
VLDVKILELQEEMGKNVEDKINEIETNSKKNIRELYGGINEIRMDYERRNNSVMDENFNLLTGPHSNLNRWKN